MSNNFVDNNESSTTNTWRRNSRSTQQQQQQQHEQVPSAGSQGVGVDNGQQQQQQWQKSARIAEKSSQQLVQARTRLNKNQTTAPNQTIGPTNQHQQPQQHQLMQQHQQHHHHQQQQQQQQQQQPTSGTQRLGSIEILNENKQRQLQLKQQESFKQHLEQRQKIIQQQADNLTYQVQTGAPEYALAMASAAAAGGGGPRSSSSSTATTKPIKNSNGGASIAVNPFDELPPNVQSSSKSKKLVVESAPIGDQPATVSGKSGFLSALMDDGTGGGADEQQQQQLDEGNEELDHQTTSDGQNVESRYNKLATAGTCSYNYEDDPNRKPFFQRDWTTILQDCRASRKLVILIVAIALLLDNMLLTSVVPIIPAYLYRLRIERQHRELLLNNPSEAKFSNNSKQQVAGGNKFSLFDTNHDGQLDDDEILSELDRRVNQSLVAVQDRFSGSVFHPRVLKSSLKGSTLGSGDDADDDDDDDDDVGDSDDGARLMRTRQDGDDDDGGGGGRTATSRRNRRPRAQKSQSRQSATTRRGKDDDNDEEDNEADRDEYENLDDDDRGVQRQQQQSSTMNANVKMRAIDGDVRTNNLAARKQANSKVDNNNNNNGNDDDDEDDDEDSSNARKWLKLKASLNSMAKMGTNDTDSLGGMCLGMVLGRPNYFDADGSGSRRRPMKINNEKGDQPPMNDSDQNDESSSTKQQQSRTKQQPRVGGDSVLARRPKVDRLRPNNKQVDSANNNNNNQPTSRPRSRLAPKSSSPTPTSEADKEQQKQRLLQQQQQQDISSISDDNLIISHQDIVDESFEVGVMFASKPIVQAIANPFVGAITNRVGFTLPMFLGFTIMFLSTLVFAFGTTYSTLFLARAIQGVGSACTSVAGMSMIADRFPDDAERGNAMAIALGGLALGVVIGPPFGGFMYEFFGKPSPFIVLAILALLDGLLQLLVLQPRITKNQEEGASLMTLIKDPYILVAAGAITFANTGIGILEPALPLWMMDTMQAKNWEQGVAFLPAALSYLFSTNLFGNLGLRIGRWRSAMLGLVIIGASLLIIPFATRVDHLIVPNGAIGFAIGMVDSTMMPMLGYLVDIRHTSVYGSVYAIGDVAFCASFVFGPALSGTLVELIGFEGLIITTALICFCFAPLLYLLRDPPARQLDESQLQEQSSLKYVNYNHLDSPDEEAQLTANSKSKSYVR